MAEVVISATPPMADTHSTGRHQREGGRPSGNSSGITKNTNPVTPSTIVKTQPTHAAPGSSARGGRTA
jgi:hypothetical protein